MPMMKLLNFRSWSLEGITPPWTGQSLFAYVQAQGGGSDLPDKTERDENKIGWTAGALDGVTSHHLFDPEATGPEQRRTELLITLEKFLKRATAENLLALYSSVRREPLLSEADGLEQAISAGLLRRYKSRVAETGRYLANEADERENVKLGIMLIELGGNESDLPILELLATHDEFTLYAAKAVVRLLTDPEKKLWDIAKRVHGWGRVQVVERLSGTRNRDIQAWMLREGFRNNVMYEYLAGVCAKTGRLHEALRPAHIDAELLDGAAAILKALVYGGPADSIDDYPQAPESVREYLRHVAGTADLDLEHLLCLACLNNFLSSDDGWGERLSKGWDDGLRVRLQAKCDDQIGRPEWRNKVDQGLLSEDNRAFYQADAAAQQLGISTRNVHFAKVKAAPLKSSSWYRLLQQTEETQIEEVLSFADGVFPLEQIATGPTDSLGFGEKYEAHRALDWVLQDLKRFPEHGWRFLKAGLQSPVTRNRNMALNALLGWPRSAWPEGAEWLLGTALQAEPNKDLRERLKNALQSTNG